MYFRKRFRYTARSSLLARISCLALPRWVTWCGMLTTADVPSTMQNIRKRPVCPQVSEVPSVGRGVRPDHFAQGVAVVVKADSRETLHFFANAVRTDSRSLPRTIGVPNR